MKNGRTLGQSDRFTQLEPVIRRSFDIASMAGLMVGPLISEIYLYGAISEVVTRRSEFAAIAKPKERRHR